MTKQQFLKKINIDNDYTYESLESYLNNNDYDIIDSYILGYDRLDDAINKINGRYPDYITLDLIELYDENNDVSIYCIVKSNDGVIDEIYDISLEKNNRKFNRIINDLQNHYYYFEDITDIPIDYCEWRWSNNAQKSIEVGICPIGYFNSYDNAKIQLELELNNLFDIYNGVSSTTYRDNYSNEIVTTTYKNIVNDICEKYFNDDIAEMLLFFDNNHEDIVSVLMQDYKNNLVNEGYHHKIYYYPLQDRDIDVGAKEIDFYMFDFRKIFN